MNTMSETEKCMRREVKRRKIKRKLNEIFVPVQKISSPLDSSPDSFRRKELPPDFDDDQGTRRKQNVYEENERNEGTINFLSGSLISLSSLVSFSSALSSEKNIFSDTKKKRRYKRVSKSTTKRNEDHWSTSFLASFFVIIIWREKDTLSYPCNLCSSLFTYHSPELSVIMISCKFDVL